jgi:hypothetical protein
MKTLARLLLRGALVLPPRDRREWGTAILAELDETRGGLESLRWRSVARSRTSPP